MNNKQEVITIPTFDLQSHHSKVSVPTDFDMRDLAKKYSIFPLKVILQNGRKRLLLAMRNPFDHRAVLDAEFRAGMTVIQVQADEVDIQWLVQTHYYGRKLSPVPSTADTPLSYNVFEQLEMTTDSQKQPEWINQLIQPFVEGSKEK
jgi:hypothetical protein